MDASEARRITYMRRERIAKGLILYLDYASVNYHDPFRVLRSFVKGDVLDAFVMECHLTQSVSTHGSGDFVQWLKKHRYIEPLAYTARWRLNHNDFDWQFARDADTKED